MVYKTIITERADELLDQCRDLILKSKGYREAVVTDMNYLVMFRVDDDTVYILGVFHELENYNRKL